LQRFYITKILTKGETMKKFNVKMTVTKTYEVDLEAENIEAAENLAMDEYTAGNLDKDNENIEFTIDSVTEAS
tara:strand:+ start:986 stop:1204 length:219 start_codon:yes stop_codon:yes gene_type:complete